MKSLGMILRRLAAEPPFRLFVKQFLALLPCSVETRAKWDLSVRPHYLLGLLFAARQAQEQKITEISAIEFGVAGGSGLVALQNEADAVADTTGISIQVYGFDAGSGGLPTFCGDYRDHPDFWKPGDYPMDIGKLRAKLNPRTTLILGDIHQTVEKFREEFDPRPIGFISFDVDLYSSSVAALRVLEVCSILRRVAIYFDDIDLVFCHQWAGELLAIGEFNEKHSNLKIDRWRGLRTGRPFPELHILDKMFICHDLKSISKYELSREALRLPL
jgi:hypothetical protein